MNKRILSNLFLALLLGCFVIFYNYKSQQSIEPLKLSSLNISDITHITIPKDNNTEFVFEKNKSAQWLMLKPYKIHAHQFRIHTLLQLSQAIVDKKYNTSTLNLADYALEKPRARIIFNKTEIAFGKTNPLNNHRYVMAENNLMLINDQTFPLVSAQAASFVNLRLLPKNSSITQIEIENNTTDQTSIIKAWQSAQAFSVHRYLPRKNLGLITVSIKNTDDQPIVFEITDDSPWLILARADLDIEYHIDISLKNSLLGISQESKPDA